MVVPVTATKIQNCVGVDYSGVTVMLSSRMIQSIVAEKHFKIVFSQYFEIPACNIKSLYCSFFYWNTLAICTTSLADASLEFVTGRGCPELPWQKQHFRDAPPKLTWPAKSNCCHKVTVTICQISSQTDSHFPTNFIQKSTSIDQIATFLDVPTEDSDRR